MLLRGWRALGVAFLAGALAGFAMPPWYWLPLAVAGIVVYVLLWDAAPTPRQALLRGFAWGTGHFAVGSYWILEAFSVPPADFQLLGPPIVLGLAFVLGFFPGMAAAVAHAMRRRWPFLGAGWRRLVLLAICWAIGEWLRSHVFTGYAWNPLGHVWAFAAPLLQSAALFGVFGLGALSFIVLAAPVAGWRAALAGLVLVAVAGGAGVMAIDRSLGTKGAGTGPAIRIVQPNIPQAEKSRRGMEQIHLARLIDLSRRPGFDRIDVVVWPETAVPYFIQPDSPALPVIARGAPAGGYLMTGAIRITARQQDGAWNSLLAIDPACKVLAHYDKVHLVPLGEYIPLHRKLAPVSGLVGRGSFEEGQSFLTIALPGVPAFSPIVCYEVIFPAEVTGPAHATAGRPQWLLNVTNDAWFGPSSGPYQHLTSARLRTIEEGLPMIRSANTGVSAVIDAYGNVRASIEMQREGIIDSVLPPARVWTPYGRWGDLTMAALLMFLVFVMVVRGRPGSRGGVRIIR